jgi:hypothetical protein
VVAPHTPTPSALDSGASIRSDLTAEERRALIAVTDCGVRGDDVIEIADALGLCGPRPTATIMPGSFVASAFGSQGAAAR